MGFRVLLSIGLIALGPALAGCFGVPGGGSSADLAASFVFLPESPSVGQQVAFRDTSAGDIIERLWEFGDGSTSTDKAPTHAYASKGVFQVILQVRDSDGRVDKAESFIGIDTDAPPIGGSTLAIDATVKGLMVSFRPLVPSGMEVSSYFWDFGDGSVTREQAPVHEYSAPGSYGVVLRVTANGTIVEAKKAVTVGGLAMLGPLADRSFAVIAIVDTGINPYHEEFRDPEFSSHPSTYIEGYPAEAEALPVSLTASQFTRALDHDKDLWGDVRGNTLYYVPGTRIAGAISVIKDGSHAILDDNGHGTATASIAAGSSIGSCPTCLIVVVEGLGDGPVNWAMDQPWIDVVSNSWNFCLFTCDADTGLLPGSPLTQVDPDDSRKAVEEGRTVLFASGNGVLNAFDVPQTTYGNAYTGPDWIVTVGAADSQSGATVVGTGRPVDIVSFGFNWKGASHTSMTAIGDFSGTSSSTPLAAGVFGRVLQDARDVLNDTHEGPHGSGVIARGDPPADAGGMLADGKLTRAEWERAVFATARRATALGPAVPTTLPDSAAYFLYAGYGLVDHETGDEAIKVVRGSSELPAKTLEDGWASVDSSIRVALWGSWNSGGGERASWSGAKDVTVEDVDTWDEVVDLYASAAASWCEEDAGAGVSLDGSCRVSA